MSEICNCMNGKHIQKFSQQVSKCSLMRKTYSEPASKWTHLHHPHAWRYIVFQKPVLCMMLNIVFKCTYSSKTQWVQKNLNNDIGGNRGGNKTKRLLDTKSTANRQELMCHTHGVSVFTAAAGATTVVATTAAAAAGGAAAARAGDWAAGIAMLDGGVVEGTAWAGSAAGETTFWAAAGELLAGGVLSWGAAEMTALFPASPENHKEREFSLGILTDRSGLTYKILEAAYGWGIYVQGDLLTYHAKWHTLWVPWLLRLWCVKTPYHRILQMTVIIIFE